jgi:signal recognition particle subunit SRP54
MGGGMPSPEELAKLAEQMPGGSPGIPASGSPGAPPGSPPIAGLPPKFPGLPGLGGPKLPGLGGLPPNFPGLGKKK